MFEPPSQVSNTPYASGRKNHKLEWNNFFTSKFAF